MPDVSIDILAQMQGAEKVTRDLDKINNEGEELHKTFRAQILTTGFERLRGEIEESIQDAKRLDTELDRVADKRAYAIEMEEFVESVREGVQATKALNGELDETGKIIESKPRGGTADEKAFAAQRAGRALSGLGQATGVGVFAQAGAALNVVDDIQDVRESFSDLSAILNPTTISLVGITAAFAVVNKMVSDTRKELEAQAAIERNNIEFEKFRTDILGQSSTALQEQSRQLQENINLEKDAVDNLTADVAEQVGNMNEARRVIELGLMEVGKDSLSPTIEEIHKYNASINDQTNRLTLVNQELEHQLELERQLGIAEQSKTATGFNLDLMEENTRREIDLRREAETITLAEAEKRVGALEDEAKTLDLNRNAIQDMIAANDALLASGTLTTDQNTELAAQQEVLHQRLGELEPEIVKNAAALEDYKNILLPAAEVNERVARTLEVLNELREQEEQRLSDTQKAYTQSANERDKAEQSLLNTEAQLAALEADRAKMLDRRAQEEALAASQNERESALQAQIDAAKTSEAINDIRRDASKHEIEIIEQTTEDAAAAWKDFRQDISKFNADWMRSELRAIQDFNLSQKRLREDTEADLKQAALDNDVNAFLAARDSAVTQLSRNSEDFTIERQRSKEDRDLQLAEMQVAFQEQQAERQRQAQETLNTIRQETNERIKIENDAANGRLSQVQALEQQLAQLRERFAQENKALQERFNQEDYNARITALNQTLEINRTNYQQLEQQTARLAYNVGVAAANGFFAGAQGQVDASIQVAINQGMVEFSDAAFGG